VVAVDVRGHGDSEAGWRRLSVDESFKHLQWSEMANDVIAVADAAKFKRAILGGMSMGSAAALWTAMLPHTRSRVAGLILIRPPNAWHEREKGACTLRRLIQTHAAFAALLTKASSRAMSSAEEVEGASLSTMTGAEAEGEAAAAAAEDRTRREGGGEPGGAAPGAWSDDELAEWQPLSKWGDAFLADANFGSEDKDAFERYLNNSAESWATISSLTPVRYIVDKVSNYPSVGAVRASFLHNDIPVVVIAHQWSSSHPLHVAKALQVVTGASWRRREAHDEDANARLVDDVAGLCTS
jgi:pimeloyl-ACP methyl ester carboxylesterase